MRVILGTVAAAAILMAAAPAFAGTEIVDYDFLSGATSVGSGEFSYDTSKTGVIGYSDLDSFSISLAGQSYDLAYVNSGGFGPFRYFAFDTSALQFVTAVVGGFPQIMSAAKSDFSSGFFVRDDADDMAFAEYSTGAGNSYDTLAIHARTAGGVPEPASWALMITGFGTVGAMMRRRRLVAA